VIAGKADAITHNFIAEKLKEQFETHAKKILGENAGRTAGKLKGAIAETQTMAFLQAELKYAQAGFE